MTLHHSKKIHYNIKFILVASKDVTKHIVLPVLKDKTLPQLKLGGKVTVVAHTISSYKIYIHVLKGHYVYKIN